MTPEQIAKKYGERILGFLDDLRSQLNGADIACDEVVDFSDDEASWSFTAHADDGTDEYTENDIDVKFTIHESEYHDGTKDGINFAVDVVTVGGIPIGGITPYNFTNRVWVPRNDHAAIEERFTILINSDSEIVHSVTERIKACL